MRLEVCTIPNDIQPIAGLRYIAEEPKEVGLILSHGFTSGKYSLDGLSSYLAHKGYNCLTFDIVGHKLGNTGGVMRHIHQAADNVIEVLEYARRIAMSRRYVLIGHSMGGAAVMRATAFDVLHPTPALPIAGVICLCTGMHPSRGFQSPTGAAMLEARADYVEGSPAYQLLSELDTMVLAAGELGETPSLFVAAEQDIVVPVAQVEALSAKAMRSEFQTINASHLDAPERSKAVVLRWLEALTFEKDDNEA